MSEEEKEAIEIVKNICINTYAEGKAKAVKTILNLIEKMQKQIEIKDNYMKLILDVLYDYDGYFSRETNEGSALDLADLIDETCDYLKKAILNDDKNDVYKSYIE